MITSNRIGRGFFLLYPSTVQGTRGWAHHIYIHLYQRRISNSNDDTLRTLWNRLITFSLVVVCLREKVLIVTFTISLWHFRSDFHFIFIHQMHKEMNWEQTFWQGFRSHVRQSSHVFNLNTNYYDNDKQKPTKYLRQVNCNVTLLLSEKTPSTNDVENLFSPRKFPQCKKVIFVKVKKAKNQ